jgi:hypothetical protein
MNERLSESTELDDATEERIAYIMDTRGYSRADAQYVLDGHIGDTGVVTPVPYEESVRQHPANAAAKRPRARYSRPRVVQDSEDVAPDLSEAQAEINTRGAALVRAALQLDTQELSGYERALARAKLERKGRRF